MSRRGGRVGGLTFDADAGVERFGSLDASPRHATLDVRAVGGAALHPAGKLSVGRESAFVKVVDVDPGPGQGRREGIVQRRAGLVNPVQRPSGVRVHGVGVDISVLLHQQDTGILDQDCRIFLGHLSREAPDGGVEDMPHLDGLELVLLDDRGCDVLGDIHTEDLVLAFSHYLLVLELDDVGIRDRILMGDDPEGVNLGYRYAGVVSSRRRIPGSPHFNFGAEAGGCVNSVPQLERSPADRTTRVAITILKVLVNVIFTGFSFTTKTRQ